MRCIPDGLDGCLKVTSMIAFSGSSFRAGVDIGP